jgi:hypothetical protein
VEVLLRFNEPAQGVKGLVHVPLGCNHLLLEHPVAFFDHLVFRGSIASKQIVLFSINNKIVGHAQESILDLSERREKRWFLLQKTIILSYRPWPCRRQTIRSISGHFKLRISLFKEHALRKSRYDVVSRAEVAIQINVSCDSEPLETLNALI